MRRRPLIWMRSWTGFNRREVGVCSSSKQWLTTCTLRQRMVNTLWNSLSSWKEPNMPTRKFEVALREPMLHLKNAVIIDLHGEINGTVEATLTVAYEQAEIQDPEMIILNFTDLDSINSTAISLLVCMLPLPRKRHRTITVYS